MISIIASSAPGLSPLARGTRPRLNAAHKIVRFIPAGAGNTIRAPESITGRPVYPRWRGEHFWAFPTPARNAGLSPLARGTPMLMMLFLLAQRFIPAGAGNTSTMRFAISSEFGLSPLARGTHLVCHLGAVAGSVYPRWRGEHHIQQVKVTDLTGLSPLARGTH